MNKQFLMLSLLVWLSVVSCKKDDGVSCTTCTSLETSNFMVCEEKDGNASVNGQNTGTPYAIYIQDLEMDGASCGNY